MKPIRVGARFISLVGLLVLMSGSARAQDRDKLPRADEVVKKAVERAKWADAQGFERKYAFAQHTVTEKLDGNGSVKERQERLYQVFPIEEVPYERLVQKNGKPLSAEELKQEQERESKFRQELAQGKVQKDDDEDDVKVDISTGGVSSPRCI